MKNSCFTRSELSNIKHKRTLTSVFSCLFFSRTSFLTCWHPSPSRSKKWWPSGRRTEAASCSITCQLSAKVSRPWVGWLWLPSLVPMWRKWMMLPCFIQIESSRSTKMCKSSLSSRGQEQTQLVTWLARVGLWVKLRLAVAAVFSSLRAAFWKVW